MLPSSLVVLFSCSVCRNFQWIKRHHHRLVCHRTQAMWQNYFYEMKIYKHGMAWHCCCKWPYIESAVKWDGEKLEAIFSKTGSILICDSSMTFILWESFVWIGTADLFGRKLFRFLLAFHKPRIQFTKKQKHSFYSVKDDKFFNMKT